MKKENLLVIVPVIIIALIVVGSTFLVVNQLSVEKDRPTASLAGQINDYSGLVSALENEVANVVPSGDIQQPFIPVKGESVRVDNENVQIFEFPSAAEVDRFAANVSADGSTVGDTQVLWVKPVHFYKSGSIIVIYNGNDTKVTSTLERLLGRQFAGDEGRTFCNPKQRSVDACIELYQPVCGWFDPDRAQCVEFPCAETFSNSCFACQDEKVLYYTEGECPG